MQLEIMAVEVLSRHKGLRRSISSAEHAFYKSFYYPYIKKSFKDE